MDSIFPRASSFSNTDYDFPAEKCVLRSGVAKFELNGSDVERLSKVKVAIPPMQNARINYCMRGKTCRLDILNLTQQKQHARLYLDSDGACLATAQKGADHFMSVGQDRQIKLGTERPLVPVPQTKNFQNAVIATPVVLTQWEQLRCSGEQNLVGGGRQALAASTSLASSTLEMTLTAGQTGVALVRYLADLAALSRGGAPGQMIDLTGGLAQLANHSQALGVATTQTAFDLAHVGFRLLQTLYGVGQYTYASAQKPSEVRKELHEPQTTLVERFDHCEALVVEDVSSLTIDISDQGPVQIQKNALLKAQSQEDDFLRELGFEKLSLVD